MIIQTNITSKNNEVKKLTYYQRMQRYACVSEVPTREPSEVGYARKSVWWMPWH